MSRLENAVPGYQHLVIEPYTPNIGATVRDIDLSDLRSEAVRAELRKALVEFQVLFFRQQTLTPEQHIEVAKVFGDPDKAKAFFPRHETQKVIEVLEARPGGNRFGTDEWHTDITFSANPPTGTVLLRGHTHVPRGETIDGLHFWNPGSLSLPKGGSPRTYGIVESGVFTVLDMQGGEILRHAPAEL